ncbi:MAG TPA: hypothetical protein VH859_03685 [Candidatus Limnocylindria bacterium]
MRLIRPARNRQDRRWAIALSIGVLLVGAVAVALMTLQPDERLSAIGALAISAAVGIGVGLAWLIRAVSNARRPMGDDLVRLLAPAFDDAYVLIVWPRLPGVPDDLEALLVGPPGVRAVIARRWRGRYRARDRAWEYDTRSRRGWIPCRTNPSLAAGAVAEAVTQWARGATDDPVLSVTPVVAFPLPISRVVLEEPAGEIVTSDNAPWYAQRIGRVQRMDAARVGRFVQAVIDAVDGPAAAREVAALL